MITRTEWYKWNNIPGSIQKMEEAGWAVRLIVSAKRYFSGQGSWDGFLVTYERSA